MINRRKILFDVALQRVAARPRKLLEALQGAMRTESDAIGIRITNERPFENWRNNVAKRMMDDAIPIRMIRRAWFFPRILSFFPAKLLA